MRTPTSLKMRINSFEARQFLKKNIDFEIRKSKLDPSI